ncbi:MAG: LPS assembly lipoprotein LptE [Pseudomonadota bacterium]
MRDEPPSGIGAIARRSAASHALRFACCAALAALTAACGFQLRGQASLPFETLYVAIPEASLLAAELKRNIIAGTRTTLVNSPAQAQAVLDLTSEERSKTILSLNTAGRVREFQLRYRLSFRVHDSKGRDYLPQTEIRLTRDISFNEAQVLSKEAEELLLFRDMQSDMVQQILRRLAAAPAEPVALGSETGNTAPRAPLHWTVAK